MGYRKKSKTYTLKWAVDHELHGLEVVLKGLTVARMLEMSSKASTLAEDPGAASVTDTEDMFRTFARSLVSWNLEDDEGISVPATYEGVTGQDLDFILDLITTWMEAVAGVDPTSPPDSGSGEPALEASLQMEALSPSLLS